MRDILRSRAGHVVILARADRHARRLLRRAPRPEAHRCDDRNRRERSWPAIFRPPAARRAPATSSTGLAESLNAMLERIDRLMAGLKEVSDNIAHDLKTPLTRLRNRRRTGVARQNAPEGLSRRARKDDRRIRWAHPDLQRASDDRPRRGRARREGMSDFDVERDRARRRRALRAGGGGTGLELIVSPTSRRLIHGNRELVGQALANLDRQRIEIRRAGERRARGA